MSFESGEKEGPSSDLKISQVQRVLLIEDDPIDRAFIERLVKAGKLSFELIHASTQEEALTLLSSHQLDCVLLDWFLPDGDGEQFLERIWSTAPWLPVVVITQRSEDHAQEVLGYGAQDFLEKGEFTSQNLRRAVEFSIERLRATRLRARLEMLESLEPSRQFTLKIIDSIEPHTAALIEHIEALEAMVTRADGTLAPDFMEHLNGIRVPFNALLESSRKLESYAKLKNKDTDITVSEFLARRPVIGPDSAPPRRLSLLILDDEVYSRLMFAQVFGQEHDVTLAASLEQAITLLDYDPERFDGILCNFLYADVRLDEFVCLLEEDLSELMPRAAFCVSQNAAARLRARLERAQVIEKPFDLSHIQQILTTWLERAAARS